MPDFPLRVLVVDPFPDAAWSLCLLLHLWGYEALSVDDGPSALEAIRAYRPDVVLLEVALPQLSGWEVVRRLRQQECCPGLLLALTGYSQEEDQARSREAGFDRHLTKPVHPEELRRLLAEYHHATKEHRTEPDPERLLNREWL